MSHGADHHVHEAQHAAHAAHDPFDKKVTLSIAIIAAILACVTMLSHRAHNATLALQGEANRSQTESTRYQTLANIDHTKASDQWSYYQAKNIRKNEMDALGVLLGMVAVDPKNEDGRKKIVEDWKTQAQRYGMEKEEITKKAKEFEASAEEFQHKAKETLENVEKRVEESHLEHLRGNRYDAAELGVEIALVLSSLAVLTKRAGFWYVGIVCCSLGMLVAASALAGLFMGHH